MSAKQNNEPVEHTIKETIISLLIALVMALVFRSYVVEAFVIPTGSMAPTLLGKHTAHTSPFTGYEWTQNPTHYADAGRQIPLPVQGGPYGRSLVSATDPMTTNRFNSPSELANRTHGLSSRPASKPLLAGDRILVQKYLYEIFPPERYDVVVFKNPTNPQENFIKRLIGLPNEQVLLAEGDIFARPLDDEGRVIGEGEYTIQRKPRRIMRDLWRPLFSTEYTPINDTPGFRMPWVGEGWTLDGREFVHGGGDATLRWSGSEWPIWDWVPYNESMVQIHREPQFPVGDVRVRAGIEPTGEVVDVSSTIVARGHEFSASLIGNTVTLRMRTNDGTSSPGEWRTLDSAEVSPLCAGRVTNWEFWHYDQRLELHLDGKIVAEGEYDWSASDRLLHTTGATRAQYERDPNGSPDLGRADSFTRAAPTVSWELNGGPVRMHRVGLDRDVYYRPHTAPNGRMGHATTPRTAIALGPDHFFTLGDNSPASQDGRAWVRVDPRVAETVDDTLGVVHRDLMLGKAFFVYFPAIHKFLDRIPIPNAGDLRFIR